MPGLFIFTLVIAVITVLVTAGVFGIGAARRGQANSDLAFLHAVTRWVAAGLLALVGLLLLVGSLTPVGTRDIGVVTSFGRLSGHLAPGINWVAPWQEVTTIDDAYQLTDETFTVRIAGGQTAQATVQIRWNAVDAAADDIFQNYKTTAGVESGLLTPELNAATNSVLDGYDPLTPLATGAKAGTADNPSTTQLGQKIQAALVSRVGRDVNIKTLVLKPLVYDATVENRINQVISQTAQTDIAQQSEKTAAAQAQANNIIAKSLAQNPLVLAQQCFNDLAAGKFTLPAGGSCYPGTGSSVVLPAK